MIDPNRIIQVEGEGLLPPVYEPQIPSDIKPDERVRVIPPCPPWFPRNAADASALFDGTSPQDQRYWFLQEAYERKIPSGLEWEGEPPPGRWGGGLGLDLLPEGTTFRYPATAQRIKLPDMWEPFGGNGMVMSRRLLDALLALDPDAIVSRSLMIRGRDDELVSDEYAMVDVVRNIAAIDIANSIIDYGGPTADGRYEAFLGSYVSSRIRDDLGPDIHIFRQRSFISAGGRYVVVSDRTRKALDAVKPVFSNLRFRSLG